MTHNLTTENFNLQLPSPLKTLKNPLFDERNIQVDVKHDDLIDPIISGNKFRKLQHHLKLVKKGSYRGVLSMGGPWSNHLHALAKVCYDQKIPLVAFVRGPEPQNYSATLNDIQNWQTKLIFLSRADYRSLRNSYEKNIDTQTILSEFDILRPYMDCYFIPEGGFGEAAIAGIEQLCNELPADYSYIYLGVGTGTTMAGLVNSYQGREATIMGVLAVNAGDSQLETIKTLATNPVNNWQLTSDYVGNGFAKSSDELEAFMWQVFQTSGLITEPVYTAKALHALYDDVIHGHLESNQKVLFLHTGGLQGLRGYSSVICQSLAREAGFQTLAN